MICLIDKVFLTYAETSLGPENADNIPDDYVQIIDRGLVDIDNSFYSKNRIAYSKNISELLAEQDFESFISQISNTNKTVYIYADEDSFNEFFIRWFKGIFPKISYQTLFYLYNSYRDYQLLLPNKRKVYLDINKDSSHISIEEILPSYWNKTISQFEGLFELYEPFKVPQEIKLKISTEIQFIQKLIDPQSVLVPMSIMRISKEYKLSFMREVCGLIRTIIRKIYLNNNNIPQNILSFNNKESIFQTITEDEELSFLLDNKLEETEQAYDYFFKQDSYIKYLQNLISMDQDISNNTDNPCIEFFLKNKCHPTPNDIIDQEILQTSPYQVFKRPIQDNELNIFLVQSVNLLKTNNSNAKELNELKIDFGI